MSQESSQDKTKKEDGAWWQPAVALFLRFSAWIAFPVLIGAYLGKWLDTKYNSAPWGFISIVGISFVVSMIGLVINASREYAKIMRDENNKEKK